MTIQNRPPTGLESLVLATIWKGQPLTAYGVCRNLSTSVLGDFPTSKGSVYPIIDRLVNRRYVKAQPVSQGERPSKQLICTMDGEEALRNWLFAIDIDQLASAEHLRIRITYLECLRPRDRRKWFIEAENALSECIEVVSYKIKVSADDDRFLACAYDNLIMTIKMQRRWLQRVEKKLETK